MWESGKKKRLDDEMQQKIQFEENKQKKLAEIIQDGNVARRESEIIPGDKRKE